jgi:ribonuclease J
MLALYTPEGVFLYSNDFKFDNNPIVGQKPNYDMLKSAAKQGVKAMVVDSLYSGDDRKTASEKVARSLLEDVMLTTTNEKAGILVTTFSSHIARLKSIVDFGKKLNRQVVFVGRSLNKYVTAAKNVRMCPFAKDIYIASYRRQVEKILKKVNKNREKYLLVTTGHQGEPHSVLDRLSRNQLPFKFRSEDHVIFSSSVIPSEVNIQNRQQLDKRIKKRGVRVFNNVHVSGHAGREDLRDFVNMINPKHVIPAHANREKLIPMVELCNELGYKTGKDVHLMANRKILRI